MPDYWCIDIAQLAQRLQRAMDDRQFRQRDLAGRAGVSIAQVWKIIHQRRPQVQADTLMRLAGALGVSLDWLVGLSEERMPDTRRARRDRPASLAARARRRQGGG